MTDLKPCPFCGETPEMVEEERLNNARYFIKCSNEKCKMVVETLYSTERKRARETWNHRASS